MAVCQSVRMLVRSALSMSSVAGSSASWRTPLVEEVGDDTQHVKDRLASDLGRVCGDDRGDLQLAETLRRHARVGDIRPSEPLERGVEAARLGAAARRPVEPATPFDVDVFRGVREQREPIECPDHVELLFDRLAAQRITKGLDGTVAFPSAG